MSPLRPLLQRARELRREPRELQPPGVEALGGEGGMGAVPQ